jgi:esterase/lipase/1-acyl-sn-glycerol-3-phosphate acyltransferase
MNRSAYLASGKVIAFLEKLSRARVRIHGRDNIPAGSRIFVVNHFTRIETLLLPYHIYQLTGEQVWSLAASSLFDGPLRGLLESVGALSTSDPDRDRLIVKSLLTGEADWIIFPEGHMVKDKGGTRRPGFSFFQRADRRPPHTGAATLALRSEFYRQRLLRLTAGQAAEAKRLQALFSIDDLAPVLQGKTWIVPINITYYPLRARENILSILADQFADNLPERLREELLTEGTMLIAGVDIDIRIGQPLSISESLHNSVIEEDMFSPAEINFNDRLPSLSVMRREAGKLMERYMAAIYAMTTVNHDHLFASLLRAMPFNTMDEADFRRRAFLLAAMELPGSDVYCHQSLAIGQISLLSDDRYHKYRDFLELARDTGLLQQHDGKLTKEPARFSSPFDLHRARLDNPLGVIANEVNPLATLQQKVRVMAWLPGFFVRKRVAAFLEQQALEEFSADYRHFSIPGETKEYAVGSPVLLRGRSRQLGIVLIHGYLAAPQEMAELAAYLHNKGLWVYQVRLRGHGTSPEDLATRTAADWVDSVDRGYALMSAICKRVVVGGFSLGGGLALDAAVRIEGLAGVFAACPPLRLSNQSARLAPVLAVWNRVKDLAHLHGHKKEFIDISPEHPHINYLRLPVQGMWELERFMKNLEERLPEVQIPALLLQSDGDPTVDPAGTEFIFEHLGSADKTFQTFVRKRHGILLGEGSQQVFAAIGVFIDRLRLTS